MSTPGTTKFGDKFWMVYGNGQRAPTYAHATEESAREEAARLANLYPGVAFHVLETVASVEHSALQWKEIL